MNDIEKRDSYQPSTTLSKLGMAAIGFTAGGILIFVLMAVSKLRVLGLVVGAVVCALGIAALTSKDPADRKPGYIITAAGVLVFLSKIKPFAPIAGTLLAIGAVGLVAVGVLNGIRFLIGLKNRSQ